MDQALKRRVPMAVALQKLKAFIAGAGPAFSLEHRIFNVSSFLITTFAVIGALANYLIGLAAFTVWFSLVGAAVSFVLFYASRFLRLFSLFTVFCYVLATCSILSVMQFFNGGVNGTVIYLYIMLLNIFLLVLPAKYQYWVYGVLYTNILVLLVLEYNFPGWVVPYSTRKEQMLDHAITMLYSLFYTTIVIVAFRRSYYNEREKVLAQNQQLMLLNEQVVEQRQSLEHKTEALEQSVRLAQEQNENINTLLKELNHRVKNNLQVVSSLLNLQAHSVQDEKAKSAILESKNRLLSMILIHQRLYHHENATQVLMSDYLKELAESIMLTFTGHLDDELITFEVEPIALPVEKAIPLGMICNELLTNAFKYAVTEQSGEITLKFKKQDGLFVLCVADNGKGFTEDPHSRSFGLQLVKSLVLQLNGNYTLGFDSGTCWEITFK
jgi:two-component sensor histidine kinase